MKNKMSRTYDLAVRINKAVRAGSLHLMKTENTPTNLGGTPSWVLAALLIDDGGKDQC